LPKLQKSGLDKQLGSVMNRIIDISAELKTMYYVMFVFFMPYLICCIN